jgi:tetratricopeptide (TPR) repeat protein
MGYNAGVRSPFIRITALLGAAMATCLAVTTAPACLAQCQAAAPEASDWMALKRQGDTAFSSNNYGAAERSFQQALTAAEKFGPKDLRLADTLHALAALYATRGQFSRAEPLYERELRVREKALGAEHPEVIAAVGKLTQFYLNHGSPQKAERLTSLLVAFAERKIKDEQALKDNLSKIDGYYNKSVDYTQAHTMLQKLQEETQRTTANENLELATTLDSLGHIYKARGKFDLAERLYKDGLAFREKTLLPEHLALATSYENLANLYAAQGKTGQAEPLFKRSLAITEKTLQPGRPEVYTRLDQLAQAYINLGQITEAEALYKRALQIMDQSSSRADVGKASLALANLYARQGRFSAAEPLFKRALVCAENANGPQHAALIPVLDSYADALAKLNKASEAARLRARARAIRGITVVEKADASDDF